MDIKIKEALDKEFKRQNDNVELIASENYVSCDILKLQGSIFTNKYAEGYPLHRYYGGCVNVDTIESLAISYACKLFNCKYANVQPHSGSSANMAVYRALLKPNDTVLGMNLTDGGHLTHGSKVSFSGIDYNIIDYKVDSDTGLIDYDQVLKIAKETKPKMIIAGASAYSRVIDFKKFKEIALEVGAYLMVDMAHIAGLVATNHHPSPIPYADVVTSTTHKTLRGPRGGIILTNDEEIIKKINKVVFPGIQGGPLMHVIAAKAQCFYEAMQPDFKNYIDQVIKNTQVLCKAFKENGIRIVSDGSDNHLLLLDMTSIGLTGKEAEELLDKINITVNKNTIPGEANGMSIASGIRIGTPAMTTRGFKEKEFEMIAKIMVQCLKNREDEKLILKLKSQVLELTSKFPIYKEDLWTK